MGMIEAQRTARERLEDVLKRLPARGPIYDVQRIDGELVLTPRVPIKRIKIDQNIKYNKNTTFADAVGALLDEEACKR